MRRDRYAGGRPDLPSAPEVCAGCGVADWTVSLTDPDGQTFHVACAPGGFADRGGRVESLAARSCSPTSKRDEDLLIAEINGGHDANR
jgi:hypothetical protein